MTIPNDPGPNDPGRLPSGPGSPDGVDLDRVWTGVAAEVWRRHPGWIERTAARLLRSPGLARALVTTPSLLLPWLISTVVAFGVGALLSVGPGQPLVWLIAPGVAAVGIAFAYGPGTDPAWELSLSCAVPDRTVLLARGTAVFAVNAALGLLASTVSGAAAALTFGWLVPMTAVCALALAVTVTVRSASVGAVAGVAAWTITVLASQTASGQATAAATNVHAYLPYLAVAACSAAIVGYATRPQREFK
jgi:hypothetical protein